MMQFDVVTLFPEMFDALTGSGITRRAREQRLLRAGAVESARFQRQRLPQRGRPAVRRRSRHGDDGRAAGEGVARGAAAAGKQRSAANRGRSTCRRRAGR